MRNIFVASLAALISLGCSGQTSKPVIKSSEVKLVNDKEPGKPFNFEITVLDFATKKPVSDVEVFAYQTNWKGDYERDAKGVARIHGTAYSDANGKVRFITIYPRGYNDSPTGEHIHFEIKARGYKNANREIMFSDGKRALPSNPEAGWVYLHSLEEKNGKLEGKATMFVVKN